MKIKMGAFAVAGFAKAYIPNYFENDTFFYVRNGFITLILIGSATKSCKFKGAFLKKTAAIALSHFWVDPLLRYCFYDHLSSKEFEIRYKHNILSSNGIVVEGNLDIEEEEPYYLNRYFVPNIRVVIGDLSVKGYFCLKPLLSGLRVNGDLDLQALIGPYSSLNDEFFFPNKKGPTLPEDLIVEGKLLLSPIQFKNLLIAESSFPKATIYISGDVDLSECTSLTSLPPNLHVNGDLDLNRCTNLTSLPENLRVDGRLILSGCVSLSHLSKGIHIGKELYIGRCTRLTTLPEGLDVEGDLYLGSSNLTSLPEGLHVGGNLRGCDSLFSLPDRLHVDGFLYLSSDKFKRFCVYKSIRNQNVIVEDCVDFSDIVDSSVQQENFHLQRNIYPLPKTYIYLPKRLEVKGSLCLNGCDITHGIELLLPEVLLVRRDLNLHRCEIDYGMNLIPPKSLHVGGNLDVKGCTDLKSLPEDFRVDGSFSIKNCTSLTSLPKELRVRQGMKIIDCDNIRFQDKDFSNVLGDLHISGSRIVLPEHLHVNENLVIDGNSSLEEMSLPRFMQIKKNMTVRNCRGLRTLPYALRVGGNLSVLSCSINSLFPVNRIGIGNEFIVGGHLDFTQCTYLTSLPNDITRMGPCTNGYTRNVDLTGTGLSDALIDRLRSTHTRGMRFHFGRQAVAINEITFNRMDRALRFWGNIVQIVELPRLSLEESSIESMVSFLGRLANTAEYRNIQTRNALALRVLDMVSFLHENEEMKSRAIDLIQGGLISCDDRVIATLDDIELLGKIHSAEIGSPSEESDTKLRDLGTAIFKLEEVRKHARMHMASLLWVDEVEVQLAFQIGLKNSLSLPISTQNMLYRGCSNVSDEDIETIRQRVMQDCTEERLDHFFKSWDPWIRHTRRKDLPKYEELLLNPEPVEGPVECEILCDETEHPVQHGQNVFDYDTLCKIYIDKGKNPFTNMAIDWKDVCRIQPR